MVISKFRISQKSRQAVKQIMYLKELHQMTKRKKFNREFLLDERSSIRELRNRFTVLGLGGFGKSEKTQPMHCSGR